MLNNPLKSPLGQVAALIALGPSAYWWWTYSGPYRWLAELQLAVFGAYEVVLTAVFTLILTSLALLLLARPLAQLGMLGRFGSMTREEQRRTYDSIESWTYEHQGRISAATLGLMGLVIGLLLLWQLERSTKLAQATAAQLEQGAVPQSDWLELSGVPLWDAMTEMKEGHATLRYVPLVGDSWSSGQPIAAFLRLSRNNWSDPYLHPRGNIKTIRVRGMRSLTGLPGPLQADFHDAGMLAADYCVLKVDATPDEIRAPGLVLAIGGAALLLITTAIWIVMSRVQRSEFESSYPLLHE